ncbi:MAG: hotdog fold thioesterase [Pseudomonadales bacterium]
MANIWLNRPDLNMLKQMNKNTLVDHLGIEFTEVGDDYIKGTMPADARTFQPYGVVHGGANVVLAETLGSLAGAHVIDYTVSKPLGQDINASHLRSVSSGFITGTARPIHLGKRSHVWEIRLEDEQGKLSCVSKLTLAIVDL